MHAARVANPVDIHVGSRIRLRRKVLRMTQEQLGEQLGVTFQQVQKYERGSNRVGAGRLFSLAKSLDVPITYFFEGLPDFHYVQEDSSDLEAAEPDQPDFIYEFIRSPDGLELAKAFSKIGKKSVRRKLLELARSLADDPEDED